MERPIRVTLRATAGTAAVLHRLRHALFALAAAAGIWFAVEVARPGSDSARSLLALTLLLWSVLALAMGFILPRLPAPVASGDGLGLRFRKRLSLARYVLMALGMLGLGFLALTLTLRALSMNFG